MDQQKYTSILMALLHLLKKHDEMNTYFDSEISFMHNSECITVQLNCDEYATAMSVKFDSKNLIRIRLVNWCRLHNSTESEALDDFSNINMSSRESSDSSSLNCITLNPEKIKLYIQGFKNHLVDYNNIESEHFQISTIEDIPDLEQYQYMRKMYDFYSSLLPQFVGLNIQYIKDEKYNNCDFIDFITKKIWGLIALS
ncbi:hypothetical protein SEPL_351 [Salmonella phage SE_PL]|nr:hypothetical protein CPT_Munch_072 [Salmonella phage Munch]ELL7856461.1 hypothetical protein [Salmonella enterica]QCW18747.1 hypothetical protein 7t3_0226 [Salmonella phage 7t3]QIG62964.1 hypothetical protein SEPL_351 [Salmonella phage SE_PL]WNV47178.1 hypothetical protein [Klebsiella phage fENko-Kae01]